MTTTTVVAYPAFTEFVPTVDERSGRYTVRFARNAGELDRIKRLRFEVFNLELREGLDSSYTNCRDEDEFDPHCHHLMVTDERRGEIVGTYRMQTAEMARAGAGFYSDQEYDLEPLAGVLDHAIELGRACVAQRHRNHRVLFLLWRGLANYVTHNQKRYFFGCCSLTSQNPVEAADVTRHLAATGQLHPRFSATPRAAYACPRATPSDAQVKLPKLMQLYLDYGARIASGPALDTHFKTIDFLALFDVTEIDARIRRLFFD